jgi:S-adenosylmethionine synthetase
MPLPIMLAHQLTRRLAEVRKSKLVPYLRPDGKSQVTIAYQDDRPVGVDAVVISTQHAADVDLANMLAPDIREHVIEPVLARYDLDQSATTVYVNPTGRFEVGGPMGDAGLTGRKIIVDTYGGYARHGGGAFSGKDPTKVDRSASYAMRWVAKTIVAAGLARRVECQVAYAIGVAHPVGFYLDCFGTETCDLDSIAAGVRKTFDLRPGAIIEQLDLRRPIYAATAAYGHFGRTDVDFTWEHTDRVDQLLSSVGRRAAAAQPVGAAVTS